MPQETLIVIGLSLWFGCGVYPALWVNRESFRAYEKYPFEHAKNSSPSGEALVVFMAFVLGPITLAALTIHHIRKSGKTGQWLFRKVLQAGAILYTLLVIWIAVQNGLLLM